MHARSEQMADYIADRLEFITFLACCSALLALLTGMNGQQALAFTALNLPFGLAILLGMAMLAPLPTHWRLPGITLLLAAAPWRPCNWGATGSIRWPSGACMPCSGWRSSGRHGPEPGLLPVPAAEFAMTADARQELEYSLRPRFAHRRGASR